MKIEPEIELLLAQLDDATRQHSERVAGYGAAVASAMGLSDAQVTTVRAGALLHEFGKLEIAPAILYKPAKLNKEEMQVFRRHCESHMEKFDGTGYPRGLKEEAIPIGARIVAVADEFDMFVADRPHHFPRALRCARDEISRWSGSWFDPEVVDIFLRMPSLVDKRLSCRVM